MANLPRFNVPNPSSRKGFTLVELMVAFAIIILMLSIMSQAFVIATNTMQGLKEVADMQEKMRPVISLLQRDLGAYHFEGTKKLSDSNFWDSGPPSQGYFMIWQEQPFDIYEGSANSNYNKFYRSAAKSNHMVAFTVKLPGVAPDEFFQTAIPNGFLGNNYFYNVVSNPTLSTDTPYGMRDYNLRRFETNSSMVHSEWAEVAYFLGPHLTATVNSTGVALPQSDNNSDGNQPLYTLYRQQRLVLPTSNVVRLPNLPSIPLPEISFHKVGANIKANTPSDLTVPWKRMGNRMFNYYGFPALKKSDTLNDIYPLFVEENATSSRANMDIVATNVISFDVRLLTDDRYDYEDLFSILSQNLGVSPNQYQPYLSHQGSLNFQKPSSIGYPNSFDNANRVVFDTWTTDQGDSSGLLPKYDFGDWGGSSGKWRPSVLNLPADLAKLPTLIPFWNATQGTGLNIKSLQISIRVWDQKSNSAKMFVVVQKL